MFFVLLLIKPSNSFFFNYCGFCCIGSLFLETHFFCEQYICIYILLCQWSYLLVVILMFFFPLFFSLSRGKMVLRIRSNEITKRSTRQQRVVRSENERRPKSKTKKNKKFDAKKPKKPPTAFFYFL